MRRIFYENGLSLVLLFLFLTFTVFQMVSGFNVFNEEQALHKSPHVEFFEYLSLPHFWSALFENWESEFLQMALLVVFSERLRQKGSAQSRKLYEEEKEEAAKEQQIEEEARKEGKTPGPVKKGGLVEKLYSNSLLLAFSILFVLSLIGHAVASYLMTRMEQLEHTAPPPGIFEFLKEPELWFESMQNWQSEFLAVFSIVVLSIWLRAKNSTESKPVGAAHDYTGH